MAKDGSHYCVRARHADLGRPGQYRRLSLQSSQPDRAPIERIRPVYKALCAEEARHANAKEGMRASLEVMVGLLKQRGLAYDEFVLF